MQEEEGQQRRVHENRLFSVETEQQEMQVGGWVVEGYWGGDRDRDWGSSRICIVVEGGEAGGWGHQRCTGGA
jgi:hypothetical protein